jgi:FkbM family methyltransferase
VKNPLIQIFRSWREWRRQKTLHGIFHYKDALMQLNRVVLPSRFHTKTATKLLASEAEIKKINDTAWQVRLIKHDITFFWPSEPDHNLYFSIEQEFSSNNPHHYTTTPIHLSKNSTIFDVGACEGLFAFRTLRQGLAKRVICFEPSEKMALLLKRGTDANGLTNRINIEKSGVGNQTGEALMITGANPDAGHMEYLIDGTTHRDAITATTIDHYCQKNEIELDKNDLIKADAEGADLDVLFGAEDQIRRNSPQIAITTYHVDDHAEKMIMWLREINPEYKLRLKGLSFWTTYPRPVLMQASTL